MRLPLLCLSLVSVIAAQGRDAPPNVLFLIADDLRNDLGCYGSTEAITPHLDALAAESIVFDRAYCQQAVCWPSRNSLFSGVRPEHLGETNAHTTFREALPDRVSLPQWFKQHGYETTGLGKLLHDGQRDPQSWSIPFFSPPPVHYARPENRDKHPIINQAVPENRVNPLFESADVGDDGYEDGLMTAEAATRLRDLAGREKPFFLMAGFHKPHTPFNAPKAYWDLYDRDQVSLAAHPFPPENVPARYALSQWNYVRSFADMPQEGPMPEPLAREIRHAYLACVSYVDALVGSLIEALKASGAWDNTVVVFTSDHGYQLGEHGLWCKHTNFELATRVPLLIRIPGGATGRSASLVELLDLYPTLASVCGLPEPDTAGRSFIATLDDPSHEARTTAMSTFRRAGAAGFSIRSESHRYTEWRHLQSKKVLATELYDHRTDPGENRNAVTDPDQAEALAEHRELLRLRLD